MRKPIATYMQAGVPHVIMEDGAVFAGYDGHSGKTQWREDTPLPGTIRHNQLHNASQRNDRTKEQQEAAGS